MIRARVVDHLDGVFAVVLIVACFALYFAIGWWTLVLLPTYCAGALAMGAYAKVPWR